MGTDCPDGGRRIKNSDFFTGIQLHLLCVVIIKPRSRTILILLLIPTLTPCQLGHFTFTTPPIFLLWCNFLLVSHFFVLPLLTSSSIMTQPPLLLAIAVVVSQSSPPPSPLLVIVVVWLYHHGLMIRLQGGGAYGRGRGRSAAVGERVGSGFGSGSGL